MVGIISSLRSFPILCRLTGSLGNDRPIIDSGKIRAVFQRDKPALFTARTSASFRERAGSGSREEDLKDRGGRIAQRIRALD